MGFRWASQSSCSVFITLPGDMCRVWLQRSSRPFVCGWLAVATRCDVPKHLTSCAYCLWYYWHPLHSFIYILTRVLQDFAISEYLFINLWCCLGAVHSFWNQALLVGIVYQVAAWLFNWVITWANHMPEGTTWVITHGQYLWGTFRRTSVNYKWLVTALFVR